MPDFDPNKHHRRSIRLSNWDYQAPAAYFVTICTHQREHLFDDPVWADAAKSAWQAIPGHTSRVLLDEWVLMPNHFHGILVLVDGTSGSISTSPFDMRWASQADDNPRPFANAPSGSLGAVIRSYKAVVTRRINRMRQTPSGKVWQRGYYERIIRNDRELERIRAYILNNPARWAAEPDDLNVLLTRMKLRG